ncbi:proline iminopeptidase [Pullulanibacillus pueri]|uniref:Proline iminopeptidase n=1 Tax=Pullulanibacillus pueri TaxID=1437324 RepID=A0A8J3EKW5_9BACL|nr:alpha/beta hydrolase [Pullulanibacillus pueri]MBM7681110.1 proline iminopeptidase [Pullulanibacillus pueri]GGH77085.1 proline iminopeptidase [Pullulanibacillus pueri]
MEKGWKQAVLKTARGTFEYFQKGKGIPLCVTHYYSDFNATGDLFADAFTPHFSVYLVNLRGTGKSTPIQKGEDIGFTETVKDLEAIRETLGFSSWSFAGHSTGGMVGLVYGLSSRSSLHQLFLVGTAASKDYMFADGCIYRQDHPQFAKMQELLNQIQDINTPEGVRTALGKERKALSLYDQRLYDAVFPPTIHKKTAVDRLNYFSHQEIHKFDVIDQLSHIDVPTWIACGKYDVQCPASCSQTIYRGIPHSELHIFEKSNHYPFAEEPVLFQAALASFIERY